MDNEHTSRPGIANSAFSIFQRDALVYVTLFFTSIIIARILGPSQMGLWSILLLLPSYATALGRPMTDVASVYFIARKELNVSTAASSLLSISIVMWLLVVLVFLAAQGWLFDSPLRHFQGREWLPLLMLLSALLDFLAMNYMYLMLAEEDVQGYNRHIVIRSILTPVLGTLMLWAIGAEIEYLAWAVVFGNFAALLYGALRVHRTHKFTMRFDVSALRMLVSFGAKLYVGSVIGFAGLYITGGIIATFLTQESVAFFQIALTRALLLTKLASALGTLLYPKIAAFNDDDDAGAITLFATVFRVNVLVTGSAALAMIVIATPTIKLLYGHSYTPVIVPFMILIAGVAIDSMTTNVLSLFSARGRPLIPTVLAAIVVIPQIVILLLIVPNGGVIIAAWITAGAFLLGTIFRLIAVKRVFAINLRDVLVPGKSDLTLIISNLLRIIRRSR